MVGFDFTTVPWGESEQQAFNNLMLLLQKATEEPLYTVDFQKLLNLFVDSDTVSIYYLL